MEVTEEQPHGTKRTLVGDVVDRSRLTVARSKAIGILATGHTWEVYTVNHNVVNHKLEVYYHGKRNIKVLRTINNKRTSSFKVKNANEMMQIEEQEVEEVMYLILAVLLNKL